MLRPICYNAIPRICRQQSLLPSRLCGVAGVLAIAFCGTVLAADPSRDIGDRRIKTTIEGEMWGAKAVNANGIDVSVNGGIVTLSGDVNNMLAKQTAVRIAKMTKGAQSVVDRLQVVAEHRSDEEIERDVRSALAADPATDSWNITVTSRDALVTLDGQVDSYAERNLAAKIAKATRGVEKLKNNISVAYTADRNDYEISSDIEQRLNWDVRLDDELVRVEVVDGDVTLRGTVGTDYEKTLAYQLAWVAGVKSIDNDQLTVEWWSRDAMQRARGAGRVNDHDIEDALERAFLYDPRVKSFNPTVSVDNGVATLTGVVDNLKAKRAAAQDAKNTVGVRRVKNYLKVRPTVTRSADEIRQDVANAFARDPFVNRAEITMRVYDGEVYLYGEVDSYYAREQAEDLAITVNDVIEVHNFLRVSYEYPAYAYYDYYDWDPTLYDYDYDYKTTRVRPDDEIKEDIESEIWWSPWVSADEVMVSVDDGTATLTGTVDSWSERSKASENAIEGGAVKVINKLDVVY